MGRRQAEAQDTPSRAFLPICVVGEFAAVCAHETHAHAGTCAHIYMNDNECNTHTQIYKHPLACIHSRMDACMYTYV